MTSPVTDRASGVVGSSAIKTPCRVATTTAVTLSGLQTIDGVTVVADDRVLVKNQTDQTANGIYIAASTGWSRAPDFDGAYDAANGTLVYVRAGTANSGFWYCTAADPVGIGTDAITFGQASSALAVISAFAQTLLDDADASTALGTLGVSTFIKTVLDDADAATARATLGLGSAATKDTGTSGAAVPLLDGTNIWSAGQQLGAPTGGDKGAGTLNAAAGVYLNGAQTRPILQDLYTSTAVFNGGLAAIPYDDTIPTSSEGTQVLSQAIVPKKVGNTIEVFGVLYMGRAASSSQMTAAVFDGGTAAVAVGTSADASGTAGTALVAVPFFYRTTAAGTTSVTYSVRAGGEAANSGLNGTGSGSRKFGGALVSWMRVREIAS